MNYRAYLLKLYQEFVKSRNNKILNDKNPLKLSDVYLSYKKNLNGLYTLTLHNVDGFKYYHEVILANVSYYDVENFISFLKSYFAINKEDITYYAPIIVGDGMSYNYYIMANCIKGLDFNYNKLGEVIAGTAFKGAANNEEKKKSFNRVLLNDQYCDGKITDPKVLDVYRLKASYCEKLSDPFKKANLRALILKKPYEVYESLDNEDKEKLLDLYYDAEVLDLNLYIDDYYSTLDPRFNKLLLKHVFKKMYSQVVGEIYTGLVNKDDSNNFDITKYQAYLNDIQLAIYDNLIIDLNANTYMYRLDFLTDQQLIDLFAKNGISVTTLNVDDEEINNYLPF